VNSFRELVEPNVVLHGSFANSTFTYDSDIDLATNTPVSVIVQRIKDLESYR